MKKMFLFLGAILFGTATFAGNNPTPLIDKVKVNTSKSTVTWVGKKITGSHTGNISFKSGELTFTDKVLTQGSFEIDMNSITCTDLSGGMADKLVGHLKADDFFGVATYPTAKFEITKAAPRGGDNYIITGNLTIKDKTESITFDAKVSKTASEATFKVDRTKYGIKYGSSSFFDNLGDKAISNDFELTIKLQTEIVLQDASAPSATNTPTTTENKNTVAPKKKAKKKMKASPKAAPAKN